eukprot:TRINITY_DN12974_c0_g1_i5.p1 TRINITY_DN12974_c0_g1~~TRINITY_DN12974_c0_g1_i5.p1  ORF type:complete len:624 (-),score=79.61 TRINITY_DN12974_c0_g1_i5:24-1829(-)
MEKDAAEYSRVLREMLREEFEVFRDTIKTDLSTIFRESERLGSTTGSSNRKSLQSCPVSSSDDVLAPYEPHEWMTRHLRTFAARQVVEDEMVRVRSAPDSVFGSASPEQQSQLGSSHRKVAPSLSAGGAGHSPEESKEISKTSQVVPTQPVSVPSALGSSAPDIDGTKSMFAKKYTPNQGHRKRSYALATVKVSASDTAFSGERTCRGFATRLMLSPYFEMASMLLIFLNAVQIGVQTHEMAVSRSTDTPQHHRVLEVTFACFFTLELVIRLYVHRLSFFYMRGWAWHVFDLVLVLLQWLEEVFMSVRGSQLDGVASSFLLRTARLLRAVRVLRILKMALTIEDLRFFVNCLISSGSAFFWSLILLSIMTYIASVYVTQMVLMERPEAKWSAKVEEELSFYFGSVPRAWLSVFEGLSGGLDWDVLAGPLFRDVSPVVGWVFLLFQAFSLLAVMNVVTATFIESALRRAESARVSMQIARAYRLFKALDVDSSGTIGFDEINDHLETAPVLEFFQDLNVHPLEAKFLFQMLDINNSGTIDFEEFLNGCIRLQGNAKALDMLLVTYDLRTAFQRNSKILHELLERVKILTDNGVYKNEEPVSA